jgi:hypothetical protein
VHRDHVRERGPLQAFGQVSSIDFSASEHGSCGYTTPFAPTTRASSSVV